MTQKRGARMSISIPVAWGDMDPYQHVNNTVYARWIESARIAFFTRVGLMERMHHERIGPILARLTIEYRRPVTYPDVIRVEIEAAKIGRTSLTLRHRISSEDQKAEVATGEDVSVVFDYRAGRPTAVDDRLRAAIAAVGDG
jgi:acyl-CoA thioester hydrolase